MSIPVRFHFYDIDGNFITTRSIFTISYGEDVTLNVIGRRLLECGMYNHKKYISENVKYAVPTNSTDYMFDLYDPTAILPNKFKKVS